MPTPGFSQDLADVVRTSPQATALRFNGESTSYGQLHALATDLARELDRLLPDRERPVCLSVGKSPEAIALVLATFLTERRVLLPSAGLGEDVLQELARRAGCSHIVALRSGGGDEGTSLLWTRATDTSTEASADAAIPEDSRLCLTTSGSTGTPKVVPLPGAGVDRFMAWATERFGIGPGSGVLSYAPLNFDLSLLDVWTTLRAGGTVTLVPADRATDAAYLLDVLSGDEVHLVQSVPMLFKLLTEAARSLGRTLPTVRRVVLTGDSTPPDLLRSTGLLCPNAALHNLYGCTETNDSFLYDITGEDLLAAAAGESWRGLPLGVPLPGVRAVLVDDDGNDIEGAGTGELLVCTPYQTAGYLDPALNPARFVRRPGAPGRTFYRTGDLVTRSEDGTLFLQGRNDFQVKVRGVRTNIQEVESVLARHPEVREAVVVPVPDPEAGSRLHALVQRAPGSRLNSLTLLRHCSSRLPRTAIPSSFVIGDEAVPRTSTGKPDRQLIRNRQLVKG
ncbi:AMP-binding protein [Streptomyces sp. SP18CS02]|uniref:AMP-binding protein n=1 Tax=Streptomyces sp. SP18CS02 TaxID=3002531 RepID=UPI002E796DE5|nr:AMP-binding protein [Streptomyces sp. SP18CS02]MEE1752049.1 AMP-binding protein [Streptomyces sp. SP18CS02]